MMKQKVSSATTGNAFEGGDDLKQEQKMQQPPSMMRKQPPFRQQQQQQQQRQPQQRKAPDPAELIAMYEAKGMNPTEASHKAISDLQKALSSLMGRLQTGKKQPNDPAYTSSRVEHINRRISVLELKMDTKPNIPQTLAIGVTAGAVVNAVPHIFKALAGMLSSFRNNTRNT